jgi:sugar lactone lactonase YvrE
MNIARPVGHWVQQNATDFSRGTLDGTVVTNDGRIVPGAKWDRLASTGEPVAWSVAKDGQGNTYLGTGHRARLFKIAPDGTVTTLYDGPEVAISALAVDGQNNVYAGVSPGGRVLRFAPGKADPQVVLRTDDVFIHALTFDAQGRLLAASGGRQGAIYRIDHPATAIQDGPVPAPLATTPQEHILSISVTADGIYAGTGDDAVLYRVDPVSGQATALYQVTGTEGGGSAGSPMGGGDQQTVITFGGGPAGGSSMYLLAMADMRSGADGNQVPRQITGAAITGLVARPDGVYFATANSGSVYRWTSARGVEEIFKTPGRAVYALSNSADGLLAGVGNAPGNRGQLWLVRPSTIAVESKGERLLDASQIQVTALGVGVVGTANNAAVYTTSPIKTPVFTSNVFDAGQVVRWGALRLNAESAQAIASVETRSGNTLEPDATWTTWLPVTSAAGESRVISPASRYLQYRVNFVPGQNAGLSRLEVLYRAANRGPSVHWTLPVGGEAFSGKKTITWAATDPDKDPLRYRMAIVKDAETPQMVELKSAATASFELDTTKYSDGQYRLRVEASDAARNPEDPLSDAVTSEPFVIDNTAPSLILPVAAKVDNGWEVRFTGTDALSPLAGAEWRLLPAETKPASAAKPAAEKSTLPVAKDADADGDDKPASTTATSSAKPDWQAAAAQDGIFDSKNEAIIARIDPDYFFVPGAKLQSGSKIELRVRDAAGNSSTATVTLP